jgi:hypothetical protein
VYFFTVKYDMASAQNAIMSVIYQKLAQDTRPPIEHAALTYDRPYSTAPLRTLFVNFLADTWTFHWRLNRKKCVISVQLLFDILVAPRDPKRVPDTT